MKTILVPVELHDLAQSTLQTAALLGKAFGSYLEGFTLTPSLSPFLAADAMGSTVLYQADYVNNEDNQHKAHQIFTETMQAHNIPEAARTKAGLRYGWQEKAQGDDFVASQGRAFDITVLGRPGTKFSQPRTSTLEAALFESGRPVLIAPPGPPRQFGENVLIVWNGSTETARTIGLALPLLARATRTIVLTVEGSGVPGPSGNDILTYLKRNEIACEARAIEPEGQSTGEAILNTAADLDCDLIIKGAYTQSRLRQMIFGGATRHVIAATDLPVFMAH